MGEGYPGPTRTTSCPIRHWMSRRPRIRENIGNPALVAEHAQDFDVLYEKFLPSVGMIEAGYFYKHLTQPLFQTQTTVPNPFPNPITPNVLRRFSG